MNTISAKLQKHTVDIDVDKAFNALDDADQEFLIHDKDRVYFRNYIEETLIIDAFGTQFVVDAEVFGSLEYDRTDELIMVIDEIEFTVFHDGCEELKIIKDSDGRINIEL